MQDVMTMLAAMRRPRILIRAARAGAQEYSRERHLRRLLGYGALPRTGPAIMRLIEIERGLDSSRRADEAGYSLLRHIDVLIALMGEANMLRTTKQTG